MVRSTDTFEDLKRKARLATIIGTLQSTLTDFKYLRKIWKDNAEEERLLGVSLTGVMDHPFLSGISHSWAEILWTPYHKKFGHSDLEDALDYLKEVIRSTNAEWADRLGIARSKQLTLVKPSGTVSQLVNSSSGMHPRYSKYYIRKVTQDNKDPLTKMMVDQQIPHQVSGDKTYFSFPIASPEGAMCGRDMTALQQLELWKIYRDCWCDGNPSQTIYYTDDEFLAVQEWVWKNWESIGGLSFFPVDDNIYEISPYNPISQEEYQAAVDSFPSIDWKQLVNYEKSDETTGSQELACAGGACEL